MLELKTSVKTTLLLLAVVGALAGCQKKEEGPVETAGKQIDQAIQKSGDKVEQATEEVGKSLEQAGQKMQDSVQKDEK